MRNLRNLHFARLAHADITAVCWDPETGESIFTVGPTAESSRIQLVRASTDDISHHIVASWDAHSPSPDLPADTVKSLQYLSGLGTTCIILEGGDIITVQEDKISQNGPHIEIVGSIDAGISAARWAPDEELLSIVTKANAFILMGSTFDPITEVNLTQEDLKASKHVSVGWGKKETQFQGRGAKALRDPTIPEKVDQGLPSTEEDGSTAISWRGDGAYVAINSAQESERRVIRVYSREGELDSASEPVDGLEAALSWRPSGNLIAGIQRLVDRTDVVFFERNGLRHGQFTLRLPEGGSASSNKIQLDWNSDSTVLAVTLKHTVQLWTVGNYHWYLKQEIPLDTGSTCLAWHPEKALILAAASPIALMMTEYIFITARGTCLPPYDNGAVAVIDGKTVNLTPFRTANVPPPMALFEITASTPVVDVAFGWQNTSFSVLHGGGVDVYDLPMTKGKTSKPVFLQTLPCTLAESSGHQTHLRLCYISNTALCCTRYEGTGIRHTQVCIDEIADSSAKDYGGLDTMDVTSTFERQDSVEAYGQDGSAKLYKLSSEGIEPLDIKFPQLLPWFDISKVDHDIVAFGLSRSGHIYANSRLLAKNCTSFIVSPSHLIFTTGNHFVKYVHLAAVDELEVPGDDPETDERCRSIERGARLVTAIPTNMSIVLQMPRGNVETIFPRAMVVAGIRTLIEEKNFGRAFSYCRTQRVDMNILYDHQPGQFLSNVKLFLDQLKDVTSIDLFLSSLREEDVTQTMYQDTKHRKTNLNNPIDDTAAQAPISKNNIVCDALLKELQPRKNTNLQNIITAHVCKSPPALDDGLLLVAALLASAEDKSLAEKAVEHICFLVDVNRVYENALGLYNLDLALLVAQQSQRDPREYLPFIQNLHALPDLRRKFEIDDHLARQTKALAHLQALDAFDDLCTYTTKHSLYQSALHLYRYNEPCIRTLTDLYAAYLESKSSFREAGLAHESLQNYAKATACYRAAGATCWQECLFTAQQQSPPLSADAMTELAGSLADALTESKDHAAAATIHAEYLSSLETAIKCLCKGYHFAEAMRLVAQKGQPGLLASAVDVGLAEALGSMTEFLADCKGQVQAQVPRVLELRRKAAEDPLAFYEGERAGGADVPDDVSVAASSRMSTSASLFTRYTGKTAGGGSVGTVGTGVSRATSKNRRREEKKRARGRKGTVYEEEYLVNSTRRLVERVAAAQPEVERLVFGLVRRGMAERARAAEALMADVVDACDAAIRDVFHAAPKRKTQQQQHSEGQGDQDGVEWQATGGQAVLQDWMASRAKALEPPPVPELKKLALLG